MHQPSHVRKEDTPLTVVRIGVCVRVLVVDTVITAPNEQTVLTSDALTDGQKDAERQLRFV